MMYYVDVEVTFGGYISVKANSKEEAVKKALSGDYSCWEEGLEIDETWGVKVLNVMSEDEEV